jgi:hypothetical protein
MRVSIVLCDFAEQDQQGGKVHMLGAGWSLIGPAPSPHAVVAFIKVAWAEANEKHNFVLRLTDSDGHVVNMTDTSVPQPLEFSGAFEIGHPPGLPLESEIDVNLVVGVQPLQLVPGQRYSWRIEIGEGDNPLVGSESFMVRENPDPTARSGGSQP